MEGYGQFCPVAMGAEVFANRWTPLILRELMAGSRRFSELQRGLPRISRNLLTQRLAWMERAGLIERRRRPDGHGGQYLLTEAGEQLRPVVVALGTWGYRWAATKVETGNLDAGLLMWFIRRRVKPDHLPAGRVVACFEFPGHQPGVFWMILDRGAAELCQSDPDYEVDLWVTADLAAFTHVFLGHLRLDDALRSGAIHLAGRRDMRQGFRNWLGISPFAA